MWWHESQNPADAWQGPAWLDRLAGWAAEHRRLLLAAVIVAQVAVLGGMIVLDSLPLVVGETVRLRVVPVDPRDLFRGDYVILRYEFSQPGPVGPVLTPLPARPPGAAGPGRPPAQSTVVEPPDGWKEDYPVYVTLEKGADGYWQPVYIGPERPAADATYLKGRYTGGQFRFGIEAFYVQEGQGLELEQARNRGQLAAEVAVAPWGQAALRGLEME